MQSHHAYALAAFCIVIFLIFVGALPLISSFAARYKITNPHYLERLCFAVVLTIIVLAAGGIVISLLPWSYRQGGAWGIIAVLLLSGRFVVRKDVINNQERIDRHDSFFLATFILFAALCTILALSKHVLPENLPDGAYVNKESVTAVRIQRFTGNLPADNVVPYVAAEYLLRSISFKENHPILPGQAVTNRPILLSLAVVPIRAALAMPPEFVGKMPTYSYVGRDWPDFRMLVRDEVGFSIYLSVAIIFNAALLLVVGVMAQRLFNLGLTASALCCALFISSPYFIFQTLFTWPKALAAFFILLALVALLVYRKFSLVGVLLGLAYLSHPYAIAYVVVFVATLALHPALTTHRMVAVKNTLLYAALVLLPWIIWSKFGVKIKSDLVAQNFIVAGQSLSDFFWVRILNVASTLLPTYLLQFPFSIQAVVSQSSVNAAGALGIVPLLFLLPAIVRLAEDNDRLVAFAMLAASALLLTLVFSTPAVPAVHGFQAVLPFALLLAVKFSERFGPVLRSALYFQVAANVIGIVLYTVQMQK